MFDFFSSDKKKPGSRNNANERLRVVLNHDRLGLSQDVLKLLQDDIIQVVSKHLEISGQPEVTLSQKGRHSVIDINVPLRGR